MLSPRLHNNTLTRIFLNVTNKKTKSQRIKLSTPNKKLLSGECYLLSYMDIFLPSSSHFLIFLACQKTQIIIVRFSTKKKRIQKLARCGGACL